MNFANGKCVCERNLPALGVKIVKLYFTFLACTFSHLTVSYRFALSMLKLHDIPRFTTLKRFIYRSKVISIVVEKIVVRVFDERSRNGLFGLRVLRALEP